MTSKKTLYDSVEKSWVRTNLWLPVLNKLIHVHPRIKNLEMLGENPNVWWNSVLSSHSETKMDVIGIALDKPSRQAPKCNRVFYGRIKGLISRRSFIKTFPYHMINLDYYGGGRWFSNKYRSEKIHEILKIIKLNLEKIDDFYLLLTLETNDLIYPWYKQKEDAVTQSPIFPEIQKFLTRLKDPDRWNLWLVLIGNAFEIIKYCQKNNVNCRLQEVPYTYIGESTKHKSRLVAYSFYLSKSEKKALPETLYKKAFSMIKRTGFVKRNASSGKVGLLPVNK